MFTRTDAELVDALQRHVELLSDFYIECFQYGNGNYFGEIAGKLRLLVCDKRNNVALLFHVARKYGIDTKYRISSDGRVVEGGTGVTLEEYLNREDLQVKVGSNMISISNKMEILYYAEKEGSAHEDLCHPEILYRMKLPIFRVNGITAHQIKIENTSRFVIEIGRRVLNELRSLRRLG